MRWGKWYNSQGSAAGFRARSKKKKKKARPSLGHAAVRGSKIEGEQENPGSRGLVQGSLAEAEAEFLPMGRYDEAVSLEKLGGRGYLI